MVSLFVTLNKKICGQNTIVLQMKLFDKEFKKKNCNFIVKFFLGHYQA